MNGDLFGVDPELAELFPGQPDLLDLARRARAGRPDAPVGEHFEAHLRARLMDAAPQHLRPRRLRLRDLIPGRRLGTGLAVAGAGLGLAMIGIVVATSVRPGTTERPVAIMVSSDLRPTTFVDPNDSSALRIDFNQPMDHGSVQRSIHIEPATSFGTTWSGNTVTIVPTNHLAGSTAYVVRLDPRTVRAVDPATKPLDRPIVMAFATRPVPAPTATPTPAPPGLPVTALGAVDPQSPLDALPGGGVVAGNAILPAPAPAPAASGAARLVPGQPAVGLGPAAAAVAVSPDGRSIASLVPGTDGSTAVSVARADGTHPRSFTARADAHSPLAWSGGAALVFVGGGRLRSVDVNGTVRDLPGPAGLDAAGVSLSPDGRRAVVRPAGAAAQLVDLGDATAAPVTVPGKVGAAAFSSDGAHLAWVELGDAPPSLRVQTLPAPAPAPAPGAPVAAPAPLSAATLLPAGSGVQSLGDVALSADGSSLAVAVVRNDGQAELRVIAVPSRTVSGTLPGAISRPLFTPGGLAAVRRSASGAEAVLVDAGAKRAGAANAVPADADELLDRLVSAETGDRSLLAALPVGGSPPPQLGSLVPGGITQAYVVAETRAPAGDRVIARLRLVAVSGTSTPVSFADETVTLDRPAPAQAYVISAATVSSLAPAPAGPHVTRVDLAGAPAARTLTVSFDADLDPGSVAASIAVVAPGGRSIAGTVTYDPPSRTAAVTLPDLPGLAAQGPVDLTVSVDTGLRDVDGQSPATRFVTTLHV